MSIEELLRLADWLHDIAYEQVHTTRELECLAWAERVRRAAEKAA